MGLGGFLKKWALPIAGVAAAPFTGGGSLLTTLGLGAKTAGMIGAGLGVAGKLASGASTQRAEDRGAQAEYDVNRVPVQNAQALQYAQAKTGAEGNRMRQIASADMLGSSKPPTDPRARMSGAGYMSPETITMMRERAMKALESGSDVPEMQTMPDRPGGGGTKMDSFLNVLNMAGTGMGALKESGVLGQPAHRGELVGDVDDLAGVLPPGQQELPPWMAPPPRRIGQINFPTKGRYF